MRILHILGGRLNSGAARGALYLHRALRDAGVDSSLVCTDPTITASDEEIISLNNGFLGTLGAHLRSKIESLPLYLFPHRRSGIFSIGISGVRWPVHVAYKDADIIHLHWVNRGMLSVAGIGAIDKPCVWTLRDMWPFTGGCHYSLDCVKYQQECGACPALGSQRDKDLSRWVFHRKVRQYPAGLTVVGISSWISECARNSMLFRNADIRTILNCVATDIFRPMEKHEACLKLGLPHDRPIILQAALRLRDEYKGGVLLEAAKQLLSDDIFICSVGHGDGNGIRTDRAFGYVNNDQKLRAIYSAADILVFPSIQDAFGKVAAEALACGTPVVAFDGTGPSSIIEHKKTGYVAASLDPSDLAHGVYWLLADRERHREISLRASEDALARFAPAAAASQYLRLYEEKMSTLNSVA